MSENIVCKTAVVANITEISTKQLCEFSDKQILRLSGRPQPFLEYSPETKPETPANATESDAKAVADRVIYHLNRARVNIDSGELKNCRAWQGMQSTGAVSCRQTLPMIYPTGSPRRKPRATEMPDGSGSYDIRFSFSPLSTSRFGISLFWIILPRFR